MRRRTSTPGEDDWFSSSHLLLHEILQERHRLGGCIALAGSLALRDDLLSGQLAREDDRHCCHFFGSKNASNNRK